MYPDVLEWGPLHIRSYGLLLAFAFLVGTWLSLKEARRLKLDEDKLISVILVTLVASVLGARALFVMEHLESFQGQWGSVFALWQGGLTLYGGLIVGALVAIMMARRLGMSMWKTADAMAPAAALGTMFGRVGCFLNGCCYGKPTSLPWGIVYPPDSFPGIQFGDVPIHPSQLYFSIAGLVLFLLLWNLRKRIRVPGELFWIFIILFALIRIPLDFTREYEPSAVVGMPGGIAISQSQVFSVIMVLFGVLMIMRLRRRTVPLPPQRPATTGSPSPPT